MDPSHNDPAFLAGFFFAVRAAEAIIGKVVFTNKASKTIDELATMIKENQTKIVDMMEKQSESINQLKTHAVFEEKLFNRLESILDRVDISSRELATIIKSVVGKQLT